MILMNYSKIWFTVCVISYDCVVMLIFFIICFVNFFSSIMQISSLMLVFISLLTKQVLVMLGLIMIVHSLAQ